MGREERARKKLRLGATGDFPRGQLSGGDEGGLRIGVTVKDKTLIVDFGKEVAWLGFDKATALKFAETIKRRAEGM